jgi:hypothetical protein
MAKEGKKKVKPKTASSPKYVTNDEDVLSSDNYASSDDGNSLPKEFVKKPNAMIKGLMKQVGARDEPSNKKSCLFKKEKLVKNLRGS